MHPPAATCTYTSFVIVYLIISPGAVNHDASAICVQELETSRGLLALPVEWVKCLKEDRMESTGLIYSYVTVCCYCLCMFVGSRSVYISDPF